MKQIPRVSIIVPVYNAQKYLRACVDSILAQTYTSFELILVDDGSTDDSGKLCDEFQAQDERVHVIHQKNAGIGAAQNAGLDTANGRYITFADNDDLMSPHLLSRLASMLEENDADMSAGGWLNVGASKVQNVFKDLVNGEEPGGKVVVVENPFKAYQNIFSVAARKSKRNGNFYYFGEANWCKLYRRELWQGIRFPVGKVWQDMYIASELYLRMKRAVTCLEPLYIWVQRGDSVTHSAERLKPTSYYLDLLNAAEHNLRVIHQTKRSILPKRSYYTLTGAISQAKRAARKSGSEAESLLVEKANARSKNILDQYSTVQKLRMWKTACWRRFESFIYFYTVFRRR